MSDSQANPTFVGRKPEEGCPMCPDSTLSDLVAELPSGRVHLQNDADYRGYCILVCRRHVEELFELSAEERRNWVEDVARIGKAIADTCAPHKLNVTMLGNLVRHLHCHVIPRYPADPEFGHPPAYRPPAERRALSPEAYADLKARLTAALAAEAAPQS